MIPIYRESFNANFTPSKYHRFLSLVEQRTGEPTPFRLNETPLFVPKRLLNDLDQAAREIIAQAVERTPSESIPHQYRVPNEPSHPLFIQVDFGIAANRIPQLVELQGFPSLYYLQPVIAECYQDAYDITLPYLPTPNYYPLLKQAILGDHDPADVALVEIDPAHQKTRQDLYLTGRILGIRVLDIRDLHKRGRTLFDSAGRPVRRIYNRAIVDELERRNVQLHFDWRDDLDVEWAGHPNWFFRLSKYSLPYLTHPNLTHPNVPTTHFLDEAPTRTDPWQTVLKPLFSFAGAGVIVGPTPEELAGVPPERRHDYILQQRIDFAPVLDSPAGPTKAELRIMYVWLENDLHFVNVIVRTGRGTQMGVDHNKGLEWVGASAAFFVDE